MDFKRTRSSRRIAAKKRNKRPANGVTGAQSIHRAAGLLRAIAFRGRDGARLVDVARQCELERPTVHRILKCLVAEGMVTQDPGTRRYFLGHLVFELGLAAAPQFNMQQLCEPALLRLAERTGDTVFLSVRSGLDTVCMDRKEGAFPIKTLTLDAGMRRPLGVGAGGIALLMTLADEEVKEIVAANAWRIAGYGNLRAAVVLDLIKRSRALGFALNDRQVTPGAISMGLPVMNPYGAPYAAISIGAIASRMSPERLQQLVALLKSEVRALERVVVAGKQRA
ncbi:MAG: IclR family transcriptional regulator [Betaproteobacteria bacterium]|nr:IclR family transcriptional regulator [Betaproteobacteria bacterium]